MDNGYQGYLQYTWSSPAMRATGQSHQMLHGSPHQHPYCAPFANQVAQYYYNQQSQHMMQPPALHPKQPQASSWDPMIPYPHFPSHIPPGYLAFSYPSSPPSFPSSPPNFVHYTDPSPSPRQQPSRFSNSNHNGRIKSPRHTTTTHVHSPSSAASVKPGVLRGPPRKPRQSGHALWVGNLPFSTDITKLKEHFSKGATAAIESVFWISRSKSAFVNYRTSEALSDAMNRFHNSSFEGVLLVCRARRADIPTPTPTVTTLRPGNDHEPGPILALEDSVGTANIKGSPSESPASGVMKAPLKNNAKKRFFILKSLAEEDLHFSVQNGHWMTQEHNETALNEAFASAEDVYLIFSANKSGEYFGYARMQGLINVLPPESRPKRPAEYALKTNESDMPEIVFTPSTECAPEGAIFIDASRGTIFWEADVASQDSSGPNLSPETDGAKSGDGKPAEPANDQEWNLGCPFEIKWISTTRLPFYRTRGLRNLWNANREVKIARDGTELETNVGVRMLELFHQPELPVILDSDSSTCMSSLTLSPA